MITVRRSALVTHSARAMYRLVADVAAYPQFLPWCDHAEVHEQAGRSVRASLHINFKGVRQTFTTANEHVEDQAITMQFVDGPFRTLEGQWRFTPLGDDACKVELELAYEFASAILGRLVGPVFDHIANTMVDAFIQRADDLHA